MKRVGKAIVDVVLGVREMGVLIPLAIAMVIFSSNPIFMSRDNIINILRNTSFVFITAIGMTYMIVSGAFDLSVGAVYAFAGVMCGKLMMEAGFPVWLAILAATALTGLAFGGVNGFFVHKVGLPPMLATLATMNIARGIVTGIQQGNPVYPLPEGFAAIGQGSLFKGSSFELPFVVLIAVSLGVLSAWALKKTVYGRAICAIGGNIETARLAGISTKSISISVFILVSALASFSGILISSRLGSAQPNVGVGYEMQTIAAVVIGGTSLQGGRGTIIGTALGALFMTTVANGMTLIRISPFWQQLVLGVVLLAACSMDYVRNQFRK
ncbi:MAG: ABC transporter permease [Clostridiales bacterium]|nr:ABC transporter permease [Clostridiales bacterium]